MAANQDEKGKAASVASNDTGAGLSQSPKLSPSDAAHHQLPIAGAVPSPDLKERLAKSQTPAQCMRPNNKRTGADFAPA